MSTTITTTITAFTASELRELHPSGFARALEQYDRFLWDSGLNDDTLTECVFPVLLETLGLTSLQDAPLRYSLSSCQGDGVSFDDFTLTYDNIKELGLTLPTGLEATDFVVRRDRGYIGNHYTHENTFDAEYNGWNIDGDTDGELYDTAWDFAKVLTAVLRDVCLKLERAGYDFVFAGTDEQSFVDNSDANENLFDEDGNTVA